MRVPQDAMNGARVHRIKELIVSKYDKRYFKFRLYCKIKVSDQQNENRCEGALVTILYAREHWIKELFVSKYNKRYLMMKYNCTVDTRKFQSK